MKSILLILFSLLVIGLQAQTAPSPAKTGTVKGTVTDKKTNEALPGVYLQLSGTNLYTFSDLNGNYEFKEVKAGTVEIKVKYVSYNGILATGNLAPGATLTLPVKLKN